MLISKDFVILNLPKTGSSYVRTVLKTIYHDRVRRDPIRKLLIKLNLSDYGYEELLMPHSKLDNNKDQHGSYSQIPQKYRDRKIVAVARNPIDRFESQYKFRWWVKHPPFDNKTRRSLFPNFPELSINEYLQLRKITTARMKANLGIQENIPIGDQTMQFIRMFFKNPFDVFPKISINYLDSNEFLDGLAEIDFLRQESLNEELAQFLAKMGFRVREIRLAREHERVNVSGPGTKSTSTIRTPEVVEYIKKHEFYLYKLLEYKGISYRDHDSQ